MIDTPKTPFLLLSILGLLNVSFPYQAQAQVTCVKATSKLRGSKRVRTKLKSQLVNAGENCPKGFLKVSELQTIPTVPSLYGDGSAGELTISTDTTLNAANTQYTNVTINSGVTLTVETGTKIRCSGSFTNNGTIVVNPASNGGYFQGLNIANHDRVASAPAGASIGGAVAGSGEFGNKTSDMFRGEGAEGLSESSAKQILRVGPIGGGGGGPAVGNTRGTGGGGTLQVICSGAISNPGTISANGESADGAVVGSGGAGGGVVILASGTSVTTSGTLTANGGDGSPSNTISGAGGGGGGGIIHLIAPTVTSSGTATASGGSGGDNSTTVSLARAGAGAGGGSCGGAGGDGGNVEFNGNAAAPEDGSDGYVISTNADPESLLQ